MSIKFKYQKQEDIPAELAGQYVEKEGAWTLNLEGAVEKSKLEELRANNQAALQQLEELQKRYEGINPEQVRALEAEKRKLEEEQALKAGEVEKVLENRLNSQKAEFEKQLATLSSDRETLNNRLVAIQIDQGVVAEASKRGLKATAIPDITARARQAFKLVDGVPTIFEPDGRTARIGRDGSRMELGEWVDALVTEAPHLFEGNSGAGSIPRAAAGSSEGRRQGAPRKNPYARGAWNLTEQMRLERTDPEMAARLRRMANDD